MAATVLIEELNTSGETPTDKTSGTLRFKLADNAIVDTENRLVIPDSGQTFSFEKWLRLNATVAPPLDIQDVEVYMDGSNDWPTGVKLWIAAAASFDGVNGPTRPNEANDPPKGPDDVTDMVNAFNYTSASPLSLETGNPGPHTGTGQFADYVVLVMEIEPGTVVGVLAVEDLTFRFKES